MRKKLKTRTPAERSDRSETGRQRYSEGYSFENRVAELFRLLHYDVEHGRLFSGRQVDLFVTTRLGDLTIHRAIECKLGVVTVDHIDSFIAKLQLVRHDYPSALGTIISSSTFTNAVTSHAARAGIKLTLFRDLEAQLFDARGYVHNLLRDSATSSNYPIDNYIEPLIGYDTVGEGLKAFAVVRDWQNDPDWSQFTLLGDVGTGKSFLSRMIARQLATEYLKNSLEKPIPILIDLRNADREFSLEGLILTHLSKNGLSQVSFEVFEYVLTQGRIVLILDGFDEMAARVTPQVTNRNFFELSRCVEGRAKVLLTCRTHYFKNRTEEEEVILGNKDDYESESARELYWELISRKGFRIAYLRPFTILQIEEYVRRVRPGSAKEAVTKIRKTYNLEELSQRPMLLEMIVKSIDKLDAKEINQSTLYKVFTDAWIHRDKWRDVLSPDSKLNFLTGLARSLWEEDVNAIHYTKLNEYVKQELAAQIQDTQQLFEIDNEIRTASFLTRDDIGRYGFAHKSYLEFFFARYLAIHLNQGNLDPLRTKRLSVEIVSFLVYLVNFSAVEEKLEAVLTGEYYPVISENALICLYGFRRHRVLAEGKENVLRVDLPTGIHMEGAQLDQITLEGAVLKEIKLISAKLEQVVLTNCDLSGADFTDAILAKADLKRTRLTHATMHRTDLSGASLEGADVSESELNSVNLTDAYLLKVISRDTNFINVTFTRAVLPEELITRLKLSFDFDRFRLELGLEDSPEVEQFWMQFENILRPMILRAARYADLAHELDPEDLVSEVALSIIKSRDLQEIINMDTERQKDYIYSTAKHIRLTRVTRGGREQNFGLLEGIESDRFTQAEYRTLKNSVSTSDPIEEVYSDELRQQIIQILPPDLLRLFDVVYDQGMTLAEAAASENISVSTAHRRLKTARELIRHNLLIERLK